MVWFQGIQSSTTVGPGPGWLRTWLPWATFAHIMRCVLMTAFGMPVDPLRFRGNLHVEGLPPWGEFDLVDRELASPAGVRLRVVKRIDRCAATNVDPVTGIRDMNIPQALMRAYDHVDCGVYAEVVTGGRLAVGDVLQTA